jgi:hypothetical protein
MYDQCAGEELVYLLSCVVPVWHGGVLIVSGRCAVPARLRGVVLVS